MECSSKIYGWLWVNKKTRSGKEWEMIWAKLAWGRNAFTQSGARIWFRDFFNYQRDILMWRLHKLQIVYSIPTCLHLATSITTTYYHEYAPFPTVQTSYLKVPRENKSLVCPKLSSLWQNKGFANRWCQLADFRERGGQQTGIARVCIWIWFAEWGSAIYYDAQFASLSVRAPRAAHPAVDIYERIYR